MRKSPEQQLADAIARLTHHREYLLYRGKGSYGGCIADDLRLVLQALNDQLIDTTEKIACAGLVGSSGIRRS